MARIPDTIPEGWEIGPALITRDEHYGLHAVCSIDEITKDDPALPNGHYLHMSISRPYQTPGWKECSRYVWESGLFDEARPIVMVLWPRKETAQGFPNVLHFWQRLSDG